ncbi:MAG: hypothetical protein V1916_03575 [Patescibacteria group bacterium]
MAPPNTYSEIQRHKPWWIYLAISPSVIVSFWAVIQQVFLGQPFGNNPAPDWGVWVLFSLCGIGLPWLLYASKQVIRFDGTTVSVAYVPFWRTRFRLNAVQSFYRREFSALRDFGGWGIRYGRDRVTAYINFRETEGVQFEFAGRRRKLLIGTMNSRQFTEILTTARWSEGTRRTT